MNNQRGIIAATLLVVIITITVLMIGVVWWYKVNQNNTTQVNSVVKNQNINSKTANVNNFTDNTINNAIVLQNGKALFIAKYDPQSLIMDAVIYDSSTNQIVKEKKFNTIDHLNERSAFSSWGSNNSVEFNSETNEIIYFTQGSSDYDGQCINPDGTCLNRFYKIGLNEEAPVKFFETEEIYNWVINADDNSIVTVLSSADGINTFSKILIGSNEKKIIVEHKFNPEINFASLVLSNDNKYIYQAAKQSVGGKATNEILYLHKINIQTGALDDIEIYKGQMIEYNTNISPDNKRISFYAEVDGNQKLFVYNITSKEITDIPYEGKIKNLTLRWSGDSQKVLYVLADQIAYYNFVTNKISSFDTNATYTSFPLSWAPSDRYILYVAPQSPVSMYDSQKNELMSGLPDFFTQITHASGISGLSWF